jgi:hypothetical protein
MGTRYVAVPFTDPETKEDHVSQLHVGYYEVVLMGGSYRIVVHSLRGSDEDGDFFVLCPVTPERYATRQEAEEALDALR